MDIPLSAYIAAGSFVVPLDGTDIVAPDRWLLNERTDGEDVLPDETRIALLKLPAFAAVVRPLLHRWIRISFRKSTSPSSSPTGICRVYVLPDDAYRRLVPRSDVKMRKDLQRLLNGLDYSQETWDGDAQDVPLLVHDARIRVGDAENNDESLLAMFNSIPSPEPRVDLVHDESYQRVMDALMTSRVPGLRATTTLYGHQMRSAAVMLQRELQPGRVVDPRLLALREQPRSGDENEQRDSERSEDQKESERSEDPKEGERSEEKEKKWWYDDVTGEVLRTARLYDGVSGGILAEEMGTGKTLICLALILATRAFPAELPDVYAVEADASDVVEVDASGVRIPASGEKTSGARTRKGVRSLADMAATIVTRQSVPWKLYLADTEANADEFRHCIAAIQRNPARYVLPKFKASSRDSPRSSASTSGGGPSSSLSSAITLSSCSLVLVPANLVRQWEEEITKHTEGLNVIVVAGQKSPIPSTAQILEADILLMSIPRFEKLALDREITRSGYELRSPLAAVHFKRVIVDEGHRLGHSKMGRKSNLLLVLDCLQVSARWIVTGTPSTGLFGVEETTPGLDSPSQPPSPQRPSTPGTAAAQQERKDLERIGAMASLYLRVRPWANTVREVGGQLLGGSTTSSSGAGDAPADWAVYVMQPHHSNRSSGRRDGLRATLDSLIIRHRTSEVGDLLPTVDERVVVLDGSYQDRLCLNLFSMMIVFNAVQSQRTDRDYFFHPKQRGALLTLLSNIRQATFFGANFFSVTEIAKALETAEKFLEDKKVPISEADERLLREAISFGHVAVTNRFKRLADAYHEVPVYVADMPGGGHFAAAWSIDGEAPKDGLTCTAAPMIRALQQFLRPCMDAPTSLRAMFDDGRYEQKGQDVLRKQHESVQKAARPNGTAAAGAPSNGSATAPAVPSKGDPTLAGNTKLGEDNHAGSLKRRTVDTTTTTVDSGDLFLAAPLANTRLVSTTSAKLSYLLDAIVRHQADEQIIVFYDNENVAFYLAEHLEILQIQHLIYAKGISAERRAQYVATFNGDTSTTSSTSPQAASNTNGRPVTPTQSATSAPTTTPTSPAVLASSFRVLLMDLSQAAFGLDMRSASRVYFTSPVLNPQVEAQAVGRVRRISQGAARRDGRRTLHVETLVLRDSLEEVIVDRRQALSAVEHHRIKTLLDDRPIYEWVRSAAVRQMGENNDGPSQLAPLKTPQFLFGRGFGRVVHPDEGLVVVERRREVGSENTDKTASMNGSSSSNGNTASNNNGVDALTNITNSTNGANGTATNGNTSEEHPPKKRKLLPNGRAPVRFA